MTEVVALEEVRGAAWALAREVKDGSDLDAREAMMRAVVSASLAFSNTRLGNVHAMALPLGGWCHVAHGTAVAALLPHVMDFNRTVAPDRYATIGETMGVKKDAKAAVAHVFALNETIGIPAHLGSVGMDEAPIPNMARDAMLSGNILVNPRATAQPDIEALHKAAL